MPDAPRTYDVFISHAAADRDFVALLAARLGQRGLQVWLAEEALKPGESWRQAIKEAVEVARLGLVILSRATDASQPMLSAEWAALVESRWERPDLALCALRLDEVEIPPFLRGWQVLRVSSRRSQDADRAADLILELARNPQRKPSEDAMRRERLRAAQRFAQIDRALDELSAQEVGERPHEPAR